MVFNSLEFAAFLPVVLAAYWCLRRRAQNLLLLVASWAFYAAWDWRFLGLMLATTVIDFTVGRLLETTTDDRRRKLFFVVSLAANLGILGFFKYFSFFIASAADLLRAIGLPASDPALRFLLPIGISFYTFHGISYTFDVYRREIGAVRDFPTFAVFVAYFPQLVAGPIGRAQIQLPQFERDRPRPSWDQLRSGVFLILLGLFKKVAIADAVAPFVNSTFSSAGRAGAAQLVIGAYLFALQIYGDFSGYSDIARGSSRLFGIELIRNFDQPYLSRNVTDFWRTWHISLSTWLRDYLYVPLGGNRRGRARTYRNLMLTMLLGGLWHGAAWTFVIWGGLHGLFLVAHRRWGERRARPLAHQSPDWWRELPRIIGTFHLVCLAWIFFRATSLEQALDYLGGILSVRGGPVDLDAVLLLVAGGVALFAIDAAQRRQATHAPVLVWPAPLRGLTYAVFVVGIIVFSGGTPVPFIYFQF